MQGPEEYKESISWGHLMNKEIFVTLKKKKSIEHLLWLRWHSLYCHVVSNTQMTWIRRKIDFI